MDALEAIKNRRSIRKYKPDPVDEKTLEAVLDAARLAPSWANTQCWKFVVVKDASIKDQISDTLTPHVSLGRNPATNAVKAAPVLIVVCAEKGIAGIEHGKPSTDKGDAWYMFDIGSAMENIALAATSLGLGTVHIGLFDSSKVAQILRVPDSYHVVAMTPLGYPEFRPNPRPRKELSEIVFHNKFGER